MDFIIKNLKKLPIAIFSSLILFIGCSEDSAPVEPEKTTGTLKTVILSAMNSSGIANANVVLYNADNNEAILRKSSDSNGGCSFECDPGNYFVRISAQGYQPSPPENNAPIPFSIDKGETLSRDYHLVALDSPQPGQISGYVNPVINNVLIVAEETDGSRYSTVTGPDGYFVLFNLPYGGYSLLAFKAGYEAESVVEKVLSSGTPSASATISLVEVNGAVLQGKVTFLASENWFVDISLVDPETFSAVPGLSTMSDTSGNDYEINMIPSGTFLAWASFMNDGYVMDPDWIFKNPGVLEVTFTDGDTLDLDFSVTDAVIINSPTNPMDSIYAIIADSTTPTFNWEEYPSAKEYIIEVRKMNGEIIWGGFKEDGSINHHKIGAQTSSVLFNFDGTASETLKTGQIYQWKVYADNDRDNGVQTLISSSEDLLGLFKIP
jgi:type 1 fimbria pilin